jgi:hypothetical protein
MLIAILFNAWYAGIFKKDNQDTKASLGATNCRKYNRVILGLLEASLMHQCLVIVLSEGST